MTSLPHPTTRSRFRFSSPRVRAGIALSVLALAVSLACTGKESATTTDPRTGGDGDGDDTAGQAGSADPGTGAQGNGGEPEETGGNSSGGGSNETGGVSGTGGSSPMGGASMGGATSVGFPTIPDYIPCSTNDDCPNSIDWECVTQLQLSHADQDGALSVSISDLDEGLSGVCSRDCSLDASVCEDLNLDSLDASAPFTCQVVWSGESPYPAGQLFPFDDAVESSEMGLGTAFAALCRPPLELDKNRSSTFCSPCSDGTSCAAGSACVDPSTGDLDPGGGGVCSDACTQQSDCPFGFECAPVSDEEAFCLPSTGTCDSCRDFDGDQRGIGHCEEEGEDCDDTNPDAYWDADEPLHPFPDHCGNFDYNCNGKDDSIEVLDPSENGLIWGALHCGACGSPCAPDDPGQVKNASLTCVANGNNGVCQAICDDVESHADCDGNIQNGCETPVAGSLYFPDQDADGFGDETHSGVFPCGEAPPTGWVTDKTDCDDSEQLVNPGASEVCDNADNNCSGTVDDLPAGSLVDHYPDADEDGYGELGAIPVSLCVWPGPDEDPRGAYSLTSDDCDDTLAWVNPGVAVDNCDTFWDVDQQVDADCDGNRLNGADQYWWHLDVDADGARAANHPTKPTSLPICVPVDEQGNRDYDYVRWAQIDAVDDCDDDDSDIYPGADDLCDGFDNDCDASTVDGSGEALWGTSCSLATDNYCDLNATFATCDGNSLVCVPAAMGETTDLPGDGFDADCDGFYHDVGASLYVIPGSIDGGDGSQEHPYNTLDAALSAADSSGGAKDTVIIGRDASTLTELPFFEEPLTLVEGVHIVGGYEADGVSGDNFSGWRLSGSPSLITRSWVEVGGSVAAVHAENITDETVLANVEITSLDPGATLSAGESAPMLIGLGLINAPGVHLMNVEIALGSGQDGGAGEAGAEGDDGNSNSGSTGGQKTCSLPDGSAIDVSGGDSAGPNPGTDEPGEGLQGGAVDEDGAYATSSDVANYGFSSGEVGFVYRLTTTYGFDRLTYQVTSGLPGSGGGAGPLYGGGSGGCGGEPGEHGGDGSSIYGVFIIGAEVDLSGITRITAGNAGLGGNGGSGGPGGDGARSKGISNVGGHGSGGLGGGGGGGGWGGDNILVLALGATTQSCPASIDTSGWGCPGEGGLGGTAGEEGARPDSGAPTLEDGEPGHWGWKDNCHVGSACDLLTGGCDPDQSCVYVQFTGDWACLPSRTAVGSNLCSL